ncbi:hypothetical protein GH714_021796 [Hevea brasiliensis]|uniref:non-specific serine/threonine protein kinase n=1 Tax=Hevea brasiliensis TaxID=3981 RepID=A0A6A6LNR1_HEVBR|nr:hypothetical protein GH714_021796 [Hevea brasiliensis]
MPEKSDIYSFGVVLLELITGRKVLDDYGETLIDWAKGHIGHALDNNNYSSFVDSRLQEYDEEEMIRMICCAAASVYKPARLRPRMTQILEVLEGDMEWRSIWLNNDNLFLED